METLKFLQEEDWENRKLGDMLKYAAGIAYRINQRKIIRQDELDKALEYVRFVIARHKTMRQASEAELTVLFVLNKEEILRQVESIRVIKALEKK